MATGTINKIRAAQTMFNVKVIDKFRLLHQNGNFVVLLSSGAS